MDRTQTLASLRRGDLVGARELRLPDGLTEVPPEVFALADTLEVLDLGRGSLTDLPADLGRLHRMRVLFASGNPFRRLPPVLGECPTLSQIGFRSCGIEEVPAEALPRDLRWLILTDNRIETLPAALGATSYWAGPAATPRRAASARGRRFWAHGWERWWERWVRRR